MIELNNENGSMIYKQIVEQICSMIKNKELLPGDKLPTERELAKQLQVSRGTVKKAYNELASNNIIEVIQGSGSYVYNDLDVYTLEERKLALRLIERTWNKLEEWNISQKEILHLIQLTALKRAPSILSVPIAIIDCNPESLTIFKNQLQYIPGIAISSFLVDTVLTSEDPVRLLESYSLILTTSSHFEKINSVLNSDPYAEPLNLIAVAATPSRQTIIDISTLPKGSSYGILCQSNKFSQIIIQQLEFFSDTRSHYPVCFSSDAKQVMRFISQHDTIITPPTLPVLDKIVSGKAMDKYMAEKRFIPFNYMFDKGSLLTVERTVENLIKERTGEFNIFGM